MDLDCTCFFILPFTLPDLHIHLLSGYPVVLRYFILFMQSEIESSSDLFEKQKTRARSFLHCKLGSFLCGLLHAKKFFSLEHTVSFMFFVDYFVYSSLCQAAVSGNT